MTTESHEAVIVALYAENEELNAAVSRGAALVLQAESEVERLRAAVATLERLNNYKLIQLGGHHEASVLGRTLGITTVRAWGKPCPVCEHALAAAGRYVH